MPRTPIPPLWGGPCLPVRVGERIEVRDVCDRMPLPPCEIATRTLRMAPVGSGRPRPPPEIVVERYRPGWWSEHEGTRHQQRRIGAGIVRLLGRRLRSGDIPGALDEPAKLGDRHRVRVDEETVDVLLMDRPFFGIELVGTHPERVAGDPHHVLRCGPSRHRVHVAIISAFGTVGQRGTSPTMATLSITRRWGK